MNLSPALVLFSGTPGTGKSATIKSMLAKVDNAFAIQKDPINEACMHVMPTTQGKLPALSEYMANDDGRFGLERRILTPFGTMVHLQPIGEFYGRHGRDQCYLIAGTIARQNLHYGKLPLFDSLPIRHILDGTAQKLLDWEIFNGFPVFLVHQIADEEDLRQRLIFRVESEPFSGKIINYTKCVYDRDAFHAFATRDQPILPEQLKNYQHLLIDSSKLNPDKCADEVINYVSN